MADGAFSNTPGYRLKDFDINCPITGDPCEAQASLVSDYVGNAGEEGVTEEMSSRDRRLLELKLMEYKVAGRVVSYRNPDNVSCPTLHFMRESTVRPKVLGGLRKLMGRNRD